MLDTLRFAQPTTIPTSFSCFVVPACGHEGLYEKEYILLKFKYKTKLPFLSFPRKRESSRRYQNQRSNPWIPAFVGMTWRLFSCFVVPLGAWQFVRSLSRVVWPTEFVMKTEYRVAFSLKMVEY
ncbi:MAG: hypothetical protein GY866_18980 [Proteobacteria bacterium]|nr:hypothetical protein [Pseudomonadota bacterium]